jgi:energy-coupling factor transport system ATP-binding protein
VGVDLRAAGLGFVYPDGTRALEGIEIDIPAGQRVALIGQNGSGKSTLVRHFNGLLRASEGTVFVGGAPVGRRHVAELARLVGIAFQNPDRQVFAARVSAEVGFGARNLGLGRAEVDRRVAAALDAVGLSAAADENPYDLGYSERKLVAIASILVMDTPVVVLDEPTTGQDLRGATRIRALVDALAAAGRTVVTITHDMAFAADAFERIVVMREGRIVLEGTPERVFAAEAWPALRSTHLEPPPAAVAGQRLALGSTPTVATFVAALSRRTASPR